MASSIPKVDPLASSIDSALARVERSDNGLAIRTDLGGLGERAALMAATHSEAREIVQGWIDRERAGRHVLRRDRLDETNSSTTEVAAATNALAPRIAEHALVGHSLNAISRTPLEDLRRANGLVAIRESLVADLASKCSLEAGLACLDRWTSSSADLPCETVRDARALFPNLTLTEICFLPLLKRIPTTYLTCSTGFDSRTAIARHDPETAREMAKSSLPETPMQLEMRVDGISFGTDLSHLGAASDGGKTSITNPDDCEITPYRPEIESKLSELVPLVIEAPRLIELLREQTAESLSVGVGRIQQAALNRTAISEPRADSASERLRSIADDVRGLSAEARLLYVAEESQITDRIVRARLRHDSGEQVSVHELVGLIGILHDVPACLLQDQPFHGKILFAGPNLLFADERDARIVEVCPLDFECYQVMRQALFSEQVASSDSNRTMQTIQRELTVRVQTALFGDLVSEPAAELGLKDRCSLIEESALDIHRRFGVSVLGLAEREIQGHLGTVGSEVSGPAAVQTRLKLSSEEMQQVQAVFERLGKELLRNVRSLDKVQRSIMSSGAADQLSTCRTTLNPESGCITITELKEVPFSHTAAAGREERAFLIAHAVGLSVWHEMPDKRFWSKIRYAAVTSPEDIRSKLAEAKDEAELFAEGVSFLRGELVPQPANFVHPIGADSFQSDFASCFAACLLDRDGFRTLAKTNTALAAKLRQTEAYLETQGVNLDSLDVPVISVSRAAKGLRVLYREIPDPNDTAAMQEFVEELKERKASSYVEDEDDHGESPLQTYAELEAARDREQSLNSLCSALTDTFGDDARKMCEEIAERLFEAVENGDIKDTLDTIADEFAELEDSLDPDDDLAQTMSDILADQGLIDDD